MNKTKTILALTLILAATLTSAISDTIYTDDYEITYSYSGAEEDDTFTLTVEINNTGGAKSEVVFEFNEDDPFDLDSDSDWNIGTLSKYETVSKSFRIEVDSGTDEGTYDLEFNLEDSDDDYDEEFEIQVDSNQADLIIGEISSSPSEILADQQDIKLEITIENIGGGDANYVRAELILPAGFEKSDSYSDFVNLGSIPSGESKTATFYIDTHEDVNEYSTAQISLNYKSDSDKKSEKLEIDLPVKPKPIFEILSTQINPITITSSDDGTLKISITNTGEKTGEETSVRIFENTDIPLEFSTKTKHIGDLQQGESGSAIFPFTVDSTALPNTYLVKIQVRTLSSDSVLTQDFNVPLTITESQSNPVKTIIISAIAILVLLTTTVIYLLRR